MSGAARFTQYDTLTPCCVITVYEVVKKKEAEKRAEADKQRAKLPEAVLKTVTPEIAGELSFGEVVKRQWEEKKRALELEQKAR